MMIINNEQDYVEAVKEFHCKDMTFERFNEIYQAVEIYEDEQLFKHPNKDDIRFKNNKGNKEKRAESN